MEEGMERRKIELLDWFYYLAPVWLALEVFVWPNLRAGAVVGGGLTGTICFYAVEGRERRAEHGVREPAPDKPTPRPPLQHVVQHCDGSPPSPFIFTRLMFTAYPR